MKSCIYLCLNISLEFSFKEDHTAFYSIQKTYIMMKKGSVIQVEHEIM